MTPFNLITQKYWSTQISSNYDSEDEENIEKSSKTFNRTVSQQILREYSADAAEKEYSLYWRCHYESFPFLLDWQKC